MAMYRASLAGDEAPRSDPVAILSSKGIVAVVITSEEDIDSVEVDSLPNLALADVSSMQRGEVRRCVRRCSHLKVPIIALVPDAQVPDLDVGLGIDDFVVVPVDPGELVTRARLVMARAESTDDGEVIRAGDLVVNPGKYEVVLKGRRIDLRFKEYELLRLLAANPGHAYTREALLSRIWGYDYFGGTRTVDVHVRRLRSKIEDSGQSFIETIWNVGYRFRDQRIAR